MREIKFRAWLPTERKWYEVDITDSSNIGVLNCNYEYVLCQFTGLKDKNMKEIYDKDLAKVCFEVYPGSKWARSLVGIYRVNIGLLQMTMDMVKLIEPDMVIDHIHLEARDCYVEDGILVIEPEYREGEQIRTKGTVEVIGNIYENPELLGGNK